MSSIFTVFCNFICNPGGDDSHTVMPLEGSVLIVPSGIDLLVAFT